MSAPNWKPDLRRKSTGKFPWFRESAAAVVLAVGLGGLVWWLQPDRAARAPEVAVRPASSVSVRTVNPSPAPAAAQSNPEFRLRPFIATRQAGAFAWTAEDGKSSNVIQQLAHNDREYQRMVEENGRIKRRQLVYRNETTAALVERAKLTGAPLQHLTLPGMDGQQVEVMITRADLSPSGQQGAFAGRVVGRDDSFVTLAFKGGREAFTVLSPTDGLFLQAEPREPGEIIVKSIDPDVYAAGYCGNP